MAEFGLDTSSALAAQVWGKKWWRQAKTESFFYSNGYVGMDAANSFIVEFPDLNAEQGYQLTYGQIRDLTGAGISGDNDLEGSEEAPDTYDDAITLAQIRNAIVTKGKLSIQYQSDKNYEAHFIELLARWKAGVIDQAFFTDLGGTPTNVVYGGDATSTATIEAGDFFTLSCISKAVAVAKKASPRIIGKMIGGGERNFACVISADQEYDLTEHDASWSQLQREVGPRDKGNLLYKNAIGKWRSTMIHQHSRVATVTDSWGSGSDLDGATALFLGVGAAAIAYSIKKIYNKKTFDYANKVGYAIGAQYGTSKTVFNGSDNALIAIRTNRSDN